MRLAWLNTRFGVNFVAAGLVTTLVTIPLIMVQDISFLVTGTWSKFFLLRQSLYILYAATAAVFCAVNFLTFRPGLPKFVTALLAISFASYVVQPFVPVHQHWLSGVCIGRILGFCSILLLVRTYLLEVKVKPVAGNAQASPRTAK